MYVTPTSISQGVTLRLTIHTGKYCLSPPRPVEEKETRKVGREGGRKGGRKEGREWGRAKRDPSARHILGVSKKKETSGEGVRTFGEGDMDILELKYV